MYKLFILLFLFNYFSFLSQSTVYDNEYWINKSKLAYQKIDYDSVSIEVIKLINNYRKEQGLNELVISEELNTYSKNWAKLSVSGEVTGHSEIEKYGYLCENINTINSLGVPNYTIEDFQKTPSKIFNGWVKSKYHNLNLLNPNAKEIGLSTVTTFDQSYKLKCVMVFK